MFWCLVAGSAECVSPDALSDDAAPQDNQYTELRAAGEPELLVVNCYAMCKKVVWMHKHVDIKRH